MKVMLCPGNSGPHLTLLKKALEDEDVEVKTIPWFGKQTPFALAKMIYHRLRGYKILNINWMPFNSTWQFEIVRGICKLMDIKVVWTIHNMEPHEPQFGNVYRDELMTEAMTRWADAGVVHSDRTYEEFNLIYGYIDLPLKVIPLANYRDVTKFSMAWMAQMRLRFNMEKKYVLMVGPSHKYKGVETFVNHIIGLPKEYVGVMVGKCKDPAMRAYLERMKEKFPDKFILDLGYISTEKLADYYAACDVFFMPYNKITTSGSIMDAITHGMSVVSTDLGNNYMLVEDGVNGYLDKVGVDMRKHIMEICENPEKKNIMVHKSLTIADRYTWDQTARLYKQVFHSLE